MKRNLALVILLSVVGLGIASIGAKIHRIVGNVELDVKTNAIRLKNIGIELENINKRVENLRIAIQPIIMRGVASWYGIPFHGRITASGERYDMNGYTLAHRSLPFGTYVKVRNIQNGLEVVGIVIDRGPFIKGRDFDLSLALARKLGFEFKGLQMVEVEILLLGGV